MPRNFEPTDAELQQEIEAVRSSWTPRQERSRQTCPEPPVVVPVVSVPSWLRRLEAEAER